MPKTTGLQTHHGKLLSALRKTLHSSIWPSVSSTTSRVFTVQQGRRTISARQTETALWTMAKLAHHRSAFVWKKMVSLWKAITRLRETPLSSFEALQWFREAQRVLLEVQAWVLYTDVVAPRLEDPGFDARHQVLPLRGVITGQLSVVEEMYRVGVPVWWIRPLHSLTDRTVIQKVVLPINWTSYFSCRTMMVHGKFKASAPRWMDGAAVDSIGEGLSTRVRKYGLLSRPQLCRSQPVWEFDEEAQEDPSSTSGAAFADSGSFAHVAQTAPDGERGSIQA